MADIIGKRSGFNYTQRWGSQLGQTGGFQLGSRPVPEADWNEMTDEEKLATMGTTDGSFLDQAHNAYQRRNQPGGDIYNERARAYEAISNAAPSDFAGVERALINAGFDPSISEQGPLFKELSQIWKGVPLINTAAYQLANQSAQFAPGMAGIQQYLPGGSEEQLLQRWHSSGTKELKPLAGGYWLDEDGVTVYDRFGFQVDPQTGNRIPGGKNYLQKVSPLWQAYSGGQQTGVLGQGRGPVNTTPIAGGPPASQQTLAPYSNPTAWGGGWNSKPADTTRPPSVGTNRPDVYGRPNAVSPNRVNSPQPTPMPEPPTISTERQPRKPKLGVYGIYG